MVKQLSLITGVDYGEVSLVNVSRLAGVRLIVMVHGCNCIEPGNTRRHNYIPVGNQQPERIGVHSIRLLSTGSSSSRVEAVAVM